MKAGEAIAATYDGLARLDRTVAAVDRLVRR